MRVTVRNLSSRVTHLADVEHTSATLIAGFPCRKPSSDTITLCGETINNGVVMREGMPLRCRECKRIQEGRQ